MRKSEILTWVKAHFYPRTPLIETDAEILIHIEESMDKLSQIAPPIAYRTYGYSGSEVIDLGNIHDDIIEVIHVQFINPTDANEGTIFDLHWKAALFSKQRSIPVGIETILGKQI